MTQSVIDLMSRTYAAYAAFDIDEIVALFHNDVVFHVAGRHPLSGDKTGREATLNYMMQIATISGGKGGFEVVSLSGDEEHAFALLSGTAYDGDKEFCRKLVHVGRWSGEKLMEFWDNPFDQYAEDEFWTAASARLTPN